MSSLYPLVRVGQVPVPQGPVNPNDPLIRRYPSLAVLTLQQRQDISSEVKRSGSINFWAGAAFGGLVLGVAGLLTGVIGSAYFESESRKDTRR